MWHRPYYRICLISFVWCSFLSVNQVSADTYSPFSDDFMGHKVSHWDQSTRISRNALQVDLDCERPSVYLCELPTEVIPSESTKTCNYRNARYHEQVYRWVAGRGCLLFTRDALFVAGRNPFNYNMGCFYENHYAPCIELPKEDGKCGCYPFDPNLEEVASAVRDAMIPSAHGRWEKCYYSAEYCCSHYMTETANNYETQQCEATFDAWTCWLPAEAGSMVSEVCSEFAYTNTGPSCNHYSYKECYQNSTWEINTDYTTCSITPRMLRRYRFHIAMLSFSIVSCLPAIIIFLFYKRLRITRVALHRNLLIAIVIRNILVIISRSEIYIDEITNASETVLSQNGYFCRVLAISERIAGNVLFICMLVEGIYLHRLIVAVFRRKLKVKWLYGFGIVLAVIPVAVWATLMQLYNNHSCWIIYTVDNIQWINDAPRVLILLINTILFIDVLRVLLTKLRNSENANQLSTTKATLFLMPIFGTQFFLTAFRPNTDDCAWEQAYYFISYTLEGLQGFFVAMLYCYINKEVHMLIKATYKKTENAVVSRIRGDSEYPRMSLNPHSARRMTYSTDLPSQQPDSKSNLESRKIHVAEIISIQASERLAEILEPEYETIKYGAVNSQFSNSERSYRDSDSIPGRDSKADDYYGFTNVSSVSIDYQDWFQRLSSPTNSIYDNFLTDYEVQYLDKNNSTQRKINDNNTQPNDLNNDSKLPRNSKQGAKGHTTGERGSECSIENDMLNEIINYMENENSNHLLDAKLFSPNRNKNDQISFID